MRYWDIKSTFRHLNLFVLSYWSYIGATFLCQKCTKYPNYTSRQWFNTLRPLHPARKGVFINPPTPLSVENT